MAADILIIEGNGIKIDEGDLSRESETMNKKNIQNLKSY